ncbi:hypothetical protein AJ79_04819 [Helicocarpus griseus UAMH5409]|uniref:Uncharacterized protein n=1 Tax=Helicocarpus griseus UAMH5409 TaxID=1447875 RepID=A0A2B7XS19_9EURO|nr:hypothetical protein AJ79_04819 [Helicocarpus griseus UAMH5409]
MNITFPGVAAVTGAGGTGIGAAVAISFANAGCSRIAITDIHEASLARVKDAIVSKHPGVQVLASGGDIADESYVAAFFAEVEKMFGRLDYAVNCAGIIGPSLRSDEMLVAEFDRINNVNYRGCWLSSRAELKLMLKQDRPEAEGASPSAQKGAIVNIASQLGIVGRPCASEFCDFSSPTYNRVETKLSHVLAAAYCGSKAAIISMTRCDAIDYSADGIRVNCVCPGVIHTPMITDENGNVNESIRPAIDIAPMKRMGEPQEVADSVLFLCSDQASFIQGHVLVVDGGYTIN